jgi:acyl dehydratase
MKTTQRTMGQMTRRMIVQYAGVVQDFNPVHYDEQFARAAGLPNVIAQGPLTVALALDALVAEHGSTSIRSLSFRLKSPVFPGDELRLTCDEEQQVQVSCGDRVILAGNVGLA